MAHESDYGDLWERIGPEFQAVAIAELDKVPRSDPFWSGTNNRATKYKAEDWFRGILAENPADDHARWLLIGFSMSGYDSSFYELFRPLIRDDPSNLRWLAEANDYVVDMSGGFQTDPFRSTILDMQSDPAIARFLSSTPEDPYGRRAVERARQVIADT